MKDGLLHSIYILAETDSSGLNSRLRSRCRAKGMSGGQLHRMIVRMSVRTCCEYLIVVVAMSWRVTAVRCGDKLLAFEVMGNGREYIEMRRNVMAVVCDDLTLSTTVFLTISLEVMRFMIRGGYWNG